MTGDPALRTQWQHAWMRPTPFEHGAPIVWRSRPGGEIGFVFGGRVVLDNDDVAAVVQQMGDPVVRRVGARGGPQGRSLLPGGWNGQREHSQWQHDPVVRLHPIGRAYSVIRSWKDDHFVGWYVNLEQPWKRTEMGFDSRDDVLDVVGNDDLTTVALKDEDELDFALDEGRLTLQDDAAIRRTADAARDDIEQRRSPFIDSAWHELDLPLGLPPVELPSGWDQPY